MNTVDLTAEFIAAVNNVPAWVESQAVKAAAVCPPKPFHENCSFPPFGVAKSETFSDGTYQPSPEGKYAVVTPSNGYEVPGHDYEDLVCWFPEKPSRWWRRLGIATALNEWAIHRAIGCNEPLTLHRTPWAWLQSNGNGAVILDLNADVRALLAGVPRVIASSLDHGKQIERWLRRRPPELPKIHVPERVAA